jgi:hypothetical protein
MARSVEFTHTSAHECGDSDDPDHLADEPTDDPDRPKKLRAPPLIEIYLRKDSDPQDRSHRRISSDRFGIGASLKRRNSVAMVSQLCINSVTSGDNCVTIVLLCKNCVSVVLQSCNTFVTRVLHDCNTIVTRLLHDCHALVTRLEQSSVTIVYKLCSQLSTTPTSCPMKHSAHNRTRTA